MKISKIIILSLILFIFLSWETNVFAQLNINIQNFDLVPDGSVNTTIIDGNNLYIGGNFTNIGNYSGNAIILDPVLNQLYEFRDKINGIVWTAVPDGNGGWYVGGDFNSVGNCNIGKLAHILSNGRVNCDFNLRLDDTVYTLYKEGNILFIGGAFEKILNRNLRYLAAVNLNNNQILNSFRFQPDDYVFTLAFERGSKVLYVGGQFTHISNLNISNASSNIPFINAIYVSSTIAEANNLNYNTPSDFYSNFNNPNLNDLVWSIVIANNSLYIAGYFDGYIRKYNFNGIRDTNFNPSLDYTVTSLAYNPTNNYLYIGGRFTTVNNNSRNYLAAINANNGSLITSFNPTNIIRDDNDVDSVLSLLLDTDRNRLYVAGSFNNNNPRFLRIFNATSGESINYSDLKLGDRINILARDGSKIFIGGRFNTHNVVWRNYLARINLQNRSVDTSFNFQTDKPVDKLMIDKARRRLYLAGPFLRIITGAESFNRTFFAAIDLSSNSLLSNFNYTFSTLTGDFINDIELDNDGNIYLAGYFERINNNNVYRYIARINANNGSLDPNFSFNPNNPVFDLEYDRINNELYLVGNFSRINNIDRKYVASINLTNSTLTQFYISNINEPPTTISVDDNDGIIALGGNFSFPKNNFVILKRDGSFLGAYYPTPNLGVNKIKIDSANNVMFVAGYFDNLGNGQFYRQNIFVATYTRDLFNILPIFIEPDYPIYDIDFSSTSNILIFGGLFESVNNNPNDQNIVRNFSIRNLAFYSYLAQNLNPTPQISSISPNQIFATTSNVTINIYGNNFVNGIVAYFNNTSLSTTFVSSTNVRALIPSNLASQAGQHTIKVINPPPCHNNQCESNSVTFTILSHDANIFLSTTTLTIQEGNNSSYRIWLSHQPTNNVTINLNFDNQLINVSPTSLTFTPSDYSTKTINITAINDNIFRGNNYQTLIRHTVSSQDSRYNNYPLGTVTVNIIDNDSVGINISAPSNITLTEGQNYQYTLRLNSQPLSTVTVSISHNPNNQLTINPTILTFDNTNWNASRTITLTAIDNNIVDGNRIITVEHRSSSTDIFYHNLTLDISVEIRDNDTRQETPPGTGRGSGGGGAGNIGGDITERGTTTQDTTEDPLLSLLLLLLQSTFQTTTSATQEEKPKISEVCQKYEKEFDFNYIKQKLPQNFYFPLKTIRPGIVNINVKYLQIILNSNEKTLLTKTGPGSKEKETRKFGRATLNAIKKFQRIYMGSKKPSGIANTNTMKEINKILKCVWLD